MESDDFLGSAPRACCGWVGKKGAYVTNIGFVAIQGELTVIYTSGVSEDGDGVSKVKKVGSDWFDWFCRKSSFFWFDLMWKII